MKNNSIYILLAIHPKIHQDCRKGHYLLDANRDVKCSLERIGAFSSVKKAESVIKQLVNQEQNANEKYKDWYNEYFGFVLEEHYIDDALYGTQKDWKNVSHFESCRTYLHDGALNCISDLDDRCEKKFTGRKCPIVHIKKGDTAIVWSGNVLTPVLVTENAMSKEEWKKNFKPGVAGDFTDDSGIAFIPKYGHCHPFSPTVFPMTCLPYFKISKKVLNMMHKEVKKYYEEGKI